MESMASAALSIGSTTAMGVEDDASSSAVVINVLHWLCMAHYFVT